MFLRTLLRWIACATFGLVLVVGCGGPPSAGPAQENADDPRMLDDIATAEEAVTNTAPAKPAPVAKETKAAKD